MRDGAKPWPQKFPASCAWAHGSADLDLVDHGHLLRFDRLADLLSEEEKPLSTDERADMLALVDHMGMDDRAPRALELCPER